LKQEKYVVKREYKEQPFESKSYLEGILPYSYYNENIFALEDFYLYWAVYQMYEGEYEKSISDFSSALWTKKLAKQENENSDSDSDISNQTDLSDVGLCSLNVNEHIFNIALCKLLMKWY